MRSHVPILLYLLKYIFKEKQQLNGCPVTKGHSLNFITGCVGSAKATRRAVNVHIDFDFDVDGDVNVNADAQVGAAHALARCGASSLAASPFDTRLLRAPVAVVASVKQPSKTTKALFRNLISKYSNKKYMK